MSITGNNNQKDKSGNKNTKNASSSKFIAKGGKPAKAAGFSKKPVKTGGTRGS